MAKLERFKGSWDELQKIIGRELGLTLVILTASDCPVCRRLKQVLPSIMKENSDINFIDVEFRPENKGIFEHFHLTNIPHIFYYKGKKSDGSLNEVAHLTGFSASEIRMKINQFV